MKHGIAVESEPGMNSAAVIAEIFPLSFRRNWFVYGVSVTQHVAGVFVLTCPDIPVSVD